MLMIATFAFAAVLAPCPASTGQPSGALCTKVTVPENRASPGGRQIALNVVVLPSRSPAGKTDPVFALAGGPGFAGTRLALAFPRLFDMLQNDHDIVLIDQRGTGESHPLACNTVDLTKNPEKVLDGPPDAAALTACRDRLSKDADLKQYTTAAAVADLDAVRTALGYAKVNILANSYGTRVALEYLRRSPGSVRAVTLNGAIGPAFKYGAPRAGETQQALQRLFTLCAADASCNAAFPKLRADYDRVAAALDKSPAKATLPLGDGQPTIAVAITKQTFIRAMEQLLMVRDDISTLPFAIHSAAGGDFTAFGAMAGLRGASRAQAADGLALSVICSGAAAAAMTPYYKAACAVWPHAAVDPAAAMPVKADVPVVLISGSLDPVASPAAVAEIAKTLPNSLHVTVANVGHVPANPCVHAMLASFLKAGSTKVVDASCAAVFPALKFVTSMPRVQ